MKFTSDVDIDFADRSKILTKIQHIPASIQNDRGLIRHNTGIYVTEIPRDPFKNIASVDYNSAEDRGYIKLDFLNVNVYQQVSNEAHLVELMMKPPPWQQLYNRDFCQQVIHIGNHHDTLLRMPEPVDTIPRLAMFLAVIRPAKRHLIGQTWAEVAQTVWQRPDDNSYAFKRSHGVAYAHLVVVHMNLLELSNQSNTPTL